MNGNINLSVQFVNEVETAYVSVKNLEGQTMQQSFHSINSNVLFQSIDLEGLSPGMYFITVQAGEELYSEKVIIE